MEQHKKNTRLAKAKDMIRANDYNKIVSVVRRMLNERKMRLIEPEEIISDAYLKYSASDKAYSLNEFINACRKQIFVVISTFEITNERGVTAPRLRYNGQDQKVCKDCKELLPIEMFRNITHKNGNNIVVKNSYCKKCQNKRSKIAEKNRRATLTDSFVVKTILSRKKNKWSKEFILARPRLIEIERRLLIRKRKRRQAA